MRCGSSSRRSTRSACAASATCTRYWAHGTSHGELETGREDIALADFDGTQISDMHIQNVVRARMGDRVGIGVLEQVTMGPHEPTGLTGFLDGWEA